MAAKKCSSTSEFWYLPGFQPLIFGQGQTSKANTKASLLQGQGQGDKFGRKAKD